MERISIVALVSTSASPPKGIENGVTPYRSTPIFDQDTLPSALRNRHNTKAGVWGVIRVIEGELKLTYLDPSTDKVLNDRMLKAGEHAIVQPQQWHFVTTQGAMKMQVDFYDQPPTV